MRSGRGGLEGDGEGIAVLVGKVVMGGLDYPANPWKHEPKAVYVHWSLLWQEEQKSRQTADLTEQGRRNGTHWQCDPTVYISDT